MKRSELFELRELVSQEVKRRDRVKELLESELIKEYIDITGLKVDELDSNNIHEILNQILSSFSITKTNGIYVCTNAYYIDWEICYEETTFNSKDVKINSECAEHKIYTDIETGKRISAIKESNNGDERPLISTFERDNTVLNPYNTYKNSNGYDEVKVDFFATALKYGQAKAKKLVLTKYPRL